MKTCPVCKSHVFDDMDVCYGCMHRFEGDGPAAQEEGDAGLPQVAAIEFPQAGVPLQPEVANRPRASALPLQPEAAEAQQAGASLRPVAAAEPPRRAVAALPQAAEPPQPEVAEPPQPEEAEPLWVSALSQPEAAGPPQQREASPEAPPAVWTIRIEVANPLRVTCSRVPSRFGALRAHAPHDERHGENGGREQQHHAQIA